MRDTSVPSLGIKNTGNTITITIPKTDAQISNQGYTYNQASFSYNQTGITYGGVYQQNQDKVPPLSTAKTRSPILKIPLTSEFLSLTASQTDAHMYDQGYTYNQAGFSYNQANIAYGGLYKQNQDRVSLSLSFSDTYSLPNNYHSIGPGWFMFVTTTN